MIFELNTCCSREILRKGRSGRPHVGVGPSKAEVTQRHWLLRRLAAGTHYHGQQENRKSFAGVPRNLPENRPSFLFSNRTEMRRTQAADGRKSYRLPFHGRWAD